MNLPLKRLAGAFALLLIFALALGLRFYGLDWSFKDGVHTFHPDENHYHFCANDLRPQWLSEEEKQLPFLSQIQLFYQRNLEVQGEKGTPNNPALRPRNYNYGTFPLHLYLAYKAYLIQHRTDTDGWIFMAFPDWLSLTALLFCAWLGLRLVWKTSKDFHQHRGRKIPWYRDPQRLSTLFPALVLPFLGLGLALYIPKLLVNYAQYSVVDGRFILIIGRTLTAWAGAFTVLLAYLIGRDAYNRVTGLVAALMLATAMLHVQTSHFATVDVMLGFWLTAGVYCFMKVAQKPRLLWYVLGALCTGFAVATKWSGILLPGILLIAHTAAIWQDERVGRIGRWIHGFWLVMLSLFTLHFYKAASSTQPSFDVTLAAFRDFYLKSYSIGGYAMFLLNPAVITVLVLLFLASLVALSYRKQFHKGQIGFIKPFFLIYRPWFCLALAILVGVLAFFFAEPMAYFDAKSFAEDMIRESGFHRTGDIPIIYTLQYRNTPSVFYTLDNLFYPSLDWLTASFVLAGCGYAVWRLLYRRSSSDVVLAAWVIPSFLLYSTFHSKFPRYMDAILPVMMVFGAKLIVDLARIQPYFYAPSLAAIPVEWKWRARRLGIAGGTLALVSGLIYGCSYVRIYDKPHTLVQASQYLKETMKPGQALTMQSWDEGIPGFHVESSDRIFIHDQRDLERTPARRAQYYAQVLNRYDYIVLQSKRGYGTTLRNPDYYPIANQFLKAFFAEQLGFRIAKVIDNPPQFLGWEFRTDLEDETARIYDHPKVIIFEKTQKFSVEQLQQLILSPPAWVGEITAREILMLQDGYPVYATPPAYPIVSWILLIQVLGWMAFIAIFPLCAPLPDRGYAIAKIAGIAVFAWACWYLASIHLAPFSRMQAFVVFFVLLLCVTFIERRYHTELWAYVKEKWLHLAGVELLFFALFFFFLAIRVWHPSIFFGEKPMNFSFINAVYRTDTFPPEDPWICNFPINYYYYGQAVFSILGRFIGLPPEYLFNLAGVTVTALAGLAVFTLAFALSRKVWVGLLAVYLSVFSAHWLTYVNIVKYKNQLQEVGVVDFLAGFVDALKGMVVAVKTLLGLRQGMMDEVIPNIYDTVFWNARNVFLGTAASEFPYWTHLFMDFHAHMLVMPFTLAFLALLYAYFAQPRKQIGNGIAVGYVAALALLLGTVICTNTWDLPALLFGVLFVMALKFWRESELLHGRATNVPWLAPETWQSLGRFPLMPTLAIFALALFLMHPFFFWFDSRVTSVGLMTQGNTPVSTYLGFFIHLLFPVITLTVLLAITRLDGQISKARTLLFGASYMGIFLLAAVYTLWNPFGFQAALPYMDGQPGLPMNYMVVGLFSPFLVVLFLSIWQRQRATPEVFALLLGVLALGLSMGIEFFYIKENWGEPNHRWNTLFKFNLQVWQYLSILAAVSILMVWRLLKQIGISVGPRFTYASRGIFLALAVFLVAGTVPFTVMAPAIVSQSGGAFARDARPPRPTLDGLAWLRVKSPGDYAAVQWLKRFVPGTPNIVELADRAYFEDARFSSNTGLPAILGWPHHVGERKHEDQKMPRKNDVERIYLSQNKQEVVTLLGQYQVEYLMFGELERSRRRDDHDALPPFGPESLARFEKWGDVFSLIFRDRGTSIFKVNTSLNSVYGLTTRGPQLPPAKQPPVMGNSMFEGGSGVSFGAFNEPRGLCEDASGFFYVADTKNNRIQVFRPSGDYAWNVGVLDGDGNEFKEPNDITIDPQTGDLFIADTWNQRVVRLNKEGTFIGAAAYDFFGPRGLVFHPGNRLLYICDTGHSQIKVLTPDGEQRMVWGQKGSGDEDLNEPVGIDVLPNGNLAILDSLNKRVKIYTPDGQMVRYWPIQTTWGGNGGFEGHLACSADSMVFVTDPKEASVHVYTESGELTGAKITTSITGEAMRFPVGVIMTSRSQVLVTDMVLRKVLRIR